MKCLRNNKYTKENLQQKEARQKKEKTRNIRNNSNNLQSNYYYSGYSRSIACCSRSRKKIDSKQRLGRWTALNTTASASENQYSINGESSRPFRALQTPNAQTQTISRALLNPLPPDKYLHSKLILQFNRFDSILRSPKVLRQMCPKFLPF